MNLSSLRDTTVSKSPIIDPAADRLAAAAGKDSPVEVVDALVAQGLGIPPEAASDPALISSLKSAAEAAYSGRIAAFVRSRIRHGLVNDTGFP